jgi:hypothetical protein
LSHQAKILVFLNATDIPDAKSGASYPVMEKIRGATFPLQGQLLFFEKKHEWFFRLLETPAPSLPQRRQ